MRRHERVVVTLGVLLAIPACQSKRKVCEHARDRLVEMSELEGQLAISDAPPDQKSVAQGYADRITNAIRDGIVAPCLELSDADRECLANIDPFADAKLAANRGLLECSETHDDDSVIEPCEKWSQARRDAEAAHGVDCVAVVDRLADSALREAGF